MNMKDTIKRMLKDNNKSQAWLAEKLNYAGTNAINNKLSRGNMKVSDLYRTCEALDYELTIQPKRRAGARPSGQIVIDGFGPTDSK